MARIPCLLVGDGPAEPTGLGRIARDLAAQIVASDLPVDFVQAGGSVPPVWSAWRHVPLDRGEDWGATCVEQIWTSLWGQQPGILFLVWDPARIVPYLQVQLPVQRWAYTAVDAVNVRGGISGPAADAVAQFDRVIAYGRWGSQVLRSCRDTVPYLPHGIVPAIYSTPASPEEQAWVDQVLGPYVGSRWVLGTVATNQARKDLGLWAQTLQALIAAGEPVYGWLHTDTLVKDWAIQQLVADCDLRKRVTVTTDTFSDRQLALLYQRCAVTLAPGLGEGFGYPIVESLASGTPVVHGSYGGGAELVPQATWRVPARAWRLESCYALQRPVFTAEDSRNAIRTAFQWRQRVGEAVCQGYCQGAVAHLSWAALWPRWRAWLRQGLEG